MPYATSWDDPTVPVPEGGRSTIRRFRLAAPMAADRTTNTGGVERIAILEDSPDGTPEEERRGPIKLKQHYFDQRKGAVTKGYFKCAMDQYGSCPACREFALHAKEGRCSEAKVRFAVNVWVYDTDVSGNIIPGTDGTPTGNVYLWQFGDTVFDKLRKAKQAWGDLRKHDFVVSPDGELQFQQVTLTIQPNSALLSAANRKDLLAWYSAEKYDVEAIVGKGFTPDELVEKLYGTDTSGFRTPASVAEAARAALSVPTDDLLRELSEELDLEGSEPAAAEPSSREQTPAEEEGFQTIDLDVLMRDI